MKYIIGLVLVIAGFGMPAVQAQSMLRVRLADNRPIKISVDNRFFNKRGTSVTVGELPEGRHYLKIYVMSQTRAGRPYERIVYEGRVRTYEDMITLVYYDPYSGAVETEERAINTYVNDHPPAATDPNGTTGGNDDHYATTHENTSVVPASPLPSGSLDNAKMEKLKGKVAAKNTDTEKMNIMKEGLNSETFNTYQLTEMMDWLSFESSKVEFAEWAYPKTMDKNYFSDVEAKLSSKNYIDELEQFLRAQKQ